MGQSRERKTAAARFRHEHQCHQQRAAQVSEGGPGGDRRKCEQGRGYRCHDGEEQRPRQRDGARVAFQRGGERSPHDGGELGAQRRLPAPQATAEHQPECGVCAHVLQIVGPPEMQRERGAQQPQAGTGEPQQNEQGEPPAGTPAEAQRQQDKRRGTQQQTGHLRAGLLGHTVQSVFIRGEKCSDDYPAVPAQRMFAGRMCRARHLFGCSGLAADEAVVRRSGGHVGDTAGREWITR